jgi:hypothetical protein
MHYLVLPSLKSQLSASAVLSFDTVEFGESGFVEWYYKTRRLAVSYTCSVNIELLARREEIRLLVEEKWEAVEIEDHS